MLNISVSDFLHLSVAERIQVAEDLCDSVAAEVTDPEIKQERQY